MREEKGEDKIEIGEGGREGMTKARTTKLQKLSLIRSIKRKQ